MEENKEMMYVCVTVDPVGVTTFHVLPYQPDQGLSLTENGKTDFLKMTGTILVLTPRLDQLIIPESKTNLILFEDSKVAMKKTNFEFVISELSKAAIVQIGDKIRTIYREILNELETSEDETEAFGYGDRLNVIGQIYHLQSNIVQHLLREAKRYVLDYAEETIVDGVKQRAIFLYASTGKTESVKTVLCNQLENFPTR